MLHATERKALPTTTRLEKMSSQVYHARISPALRRSSLSCDSPPRQNNHWTSWLGLVGITSHELAFVINYARHCGWPCWVAACHSRLQLQLPASLLACSVEATVYCACSKPLTSPAGALVKQLGTGKPRKTPISPG